MPLWKLDLAIIWSSPEKIAAQFTNIKWMNVFQLELIDKIQKSRSLFSLCVVYRAFLTGKSHFYLLGLKLTEIVSQPLKMSNWLINDRVVLKILIFIKDPVWTPTCRNGFWEPIKNTPVEISFKPIFCQYVFYHLTVNHYLSSLRTETENCKKKAKRDEPSRTTHSYASD